MEFLVNSKICRFSYEVFCLFGQIKHSFAIRLVGTTTLAVTLLIATAVQIIKFIEDGFTLHLIIEIIPPMTATLLCFLLIPVSIMSKKNHEAIYLFMVEDRKKKKSLEELKILKKHADASERLVMYVTFYFALAVISINTTSIIPQFLDWIQPLNVSRPRKLPFNAVYLIINERDHFYLIAIGQFLTMTMISLLIGGSENMFVILIHHTCGLFEVAGYRLENMMQMFHTDEFGPQQEKLLVQNIEMYIKDHRRVLEFAALIESSADGRIFIALIGTIVAFSVSLAEITNVELINAKSVIFSVGQIGQLFVVSCMGQKLIDTSNKLSYNVYNSKWYYYPAKFQKLIFMIILRAHKPYYLTAGYLYRVSLENFGQVIQTALSYCMVLRNFQ